MAATVNNESPETADARAEQALRAEREIAVRAAIGPLALTDAVFFTSGDTQIRIADIPASWSFDGIDMTVIPDQVEGPELLEFRLLNNGKAIDAPLTMIDDEKPGSSELTILVRTPPSSKGAQSSLESTPLNGTDAEAGPVQITARFARRADTAAIRVWRDDAPALLAFAGIEFFDFDPRWVVQGSYRTYRPGEDGRDSGYTYAGLDIPYRHEAPGEITFTMEGAHFTLPVYSNTDEGVFLVVADQTRGKEVDQPMRALDIAVPRRPAPGETVPVTIDFNRLELFPCAFSPHFTCPIPDPSSRLALRITAGERGVRSIAEPNGAVRGFIPEFDVADLGPSM